MNKALIVTSLEHRVRSLLAQALPPEEFVKAYSYSRTWFLDMLATTRPHVYAPKNPVEICGVKFRNDLGNAAGFDKDGKLLAFNYLSGAGFGVVGTVLDDANDGNLIETYGRKSNPWTPLPRSRSALNSLGLPNHGVDYVVQKIVEFREIFQPIDFPIVASVMGHPKKTNEQLKLYGIMRSLDKLLPVVDAIEINESCPNTDHSHDDLELRLKAIISMRDSYEARFGKYVPVFVKLRDAGNATYTVEFMTKVGVDGLVLTNTQIDYGALRRKVHPDDRKIFDYYTKHHKGGMSGPIIKDVSFKQAEAAISAIDHQGSYLVVNHVGGIEKFEDMQRSRAISPFVKLREFYTGLMNMIGERPVDRIYPYMVNGFPKKRLNSVNLTE